MTSRTLTVTAAYQSTNTLRNCFSDLATSSRRSLSSRPTSITIFTMETKYNWPPQNQPAQVLMPRASNLSRPLQQQSSSMGEPSIEKIWSPSMPSALNRLQPLKVPMRPSTNYLTTWPLTQTTVLSTEPVIWFLLLTMMLYFLMNPKSAAELDPTSSLLKMNQSHDGMVPS